jgi:hypothetical protein
MRGYCSSTAWTSAISLASRSRNRVGGMLSFATTPSAGYAGLKSRYTTPDQLKYLGNRQIVAKPRHSRIGAELDSRACVVASEMPRARA